MLKRVVMPFGVLASLAGCATLSPKEPSAERQLWSEERCFAHVVPDWRSIEASELKGVVFTASSTPAEWPIPVAVVFARSWPRGAVIRTQVDENGRFSVPQLREGTYEVAVCADGWNPWRGTVRLTRRARHTALSFPLELGQ